MAIADAAERDEDRARSLTVQRRPAASAAALAEPGRAYVVLVNYGDPSDTIECLETLFRMDYPDYRVIVCDNAASESSFGALRAWAEGSLHAVPSGETGRRLAPAPTKKPLAYHVASAEAVERGEAADAGQPLVLIRSARNRGFAGGCNLGLRYGLARNDAAWFWLLNNDTAVTPNALSALVEHCRGTPRVGICGSTLVYYDTPDRLQALGGGRYNPWLGRMHLLGFQQRPLPGLAATAADMDFVHGASMLVSRAFVDAVGLMDERYFLYFEELDWTARARGRFALGHAPFSVVFHKDGGAAGSATRTPLLRSPTADYHGLRSRLIYTRRHRRWALPTVWLGLLAALANRIRRGQWERVPMILSLMAGRT